jgi:hypothetical protein
MAVRSTHIPRSPTRKEPLTSRLRGAWRRALAECCTVCAALFWQHRRATTPQLVTRSQPIITDQLLADIIGTLWELATHAELHQVDARPIARAHALRGQLERIQQIRRAYDSRSMDIPLSALQRGAYEPE